MGDARRSPAPQIRAAVKVIEAGEPVTQVARDLGMSRATLCRQIRELPTREGLGFTYAPETPATTLRELLHQRRHDEVKPPVVV